MLVFRLDDDGIALPRSSVSGGTLFPAAAGATFFFHFHLIVLVLGGLATATAMGACDVMRLDKGHTEGLEPNVTETLIKMIVAAPGGKARQLAAV